MSDEAKEIRGRIASLEAACREMFAGTALAIKTLVVTLESVGLSSDLVVAAFDLERAKSPPGHLRCLMLQAVADALRLDGPLH
jgi:hypothetical protein